ncbi:hypothetical protein OG974_32395 (plasmid) [Streptomyces sp. NBC_00597]|uniref:hypothetical protein n=1 Tax=unclassified Streptomyces TaxID=2593676 RepID=UPI002E151C81|nr:hypothetical protein OG573_42410 [Streptomyces sp. NBC_01205]
MKTASRRQCAAAKRRRGSKNTLCRGELRVSELDASPGEYEDGLQPTAQQWYQNGIKDADMKMGERY